MRRRTLLRRSAAVGALALTGCVSSGTDSPGGAGDGGEGTATPTDTGTPTPTPTPRPPAVTNSVIETTKTGCASGDTGTATVGFDPEGSAVTVYGVLVAATPCHVAALDSVAYDPERMVLEVVVVTEDDPDAEMCVQCLGAVHYDATVDFEGGLPGTVAVTHDTGEDATEVTRVARDGTS